MIRRVLQHAIAPAITLVAVALSAVVAGYATAASDSRGGPAFPEPSPAPSTREVVRGFVLGLSGDTLTISAGGTETNFRLQPATVIEALRPTNLAEVIAGDWLNGAAINHPQTTLALTGIIVIPQSQLATQSR